MIGRTKSRAKKYAKTSKKWKKGIKRYVISFIPGSAAEKRFLKEFRKQHGLKEE